MPERGYHTGVVTIDIATAIVLGAKAVVVGDRLLAGVPTIFEVDNDGKYIAVGEMTQEQAGVRVTMPNGEVILYMTNTREQARELLAEAELLLVPADKTLCIGEDHHYARGSNQCECGDMTLWMIGQ